MIRQVRRLGVAMLVLYGVLFVQLNVIQVIRADHYNKNPANVRAGFPPACRTPRRDKLLDGPHPTHKW